MRTMRILALLVILLMLFDVMGIYLLSCKVNNRTETELKDSLYYDTCLTEEPDGVEDYSDSSVYNYEPPVIPYFVKNLLANANWWADTLCVVDNKAYYTAYEDYGRLFVLYNEDKILVADPALKVYPCDAGGDNKYYVSVVGKSLLVDLSDDNSKRALNRLKRKLPPFIRYRHDTIAGFGKTVFYSIAVDFPTPSAMHADIIGRWLVDKIADSQSRKEKVPALNALYIGYSPRSNGGCTYEGDVQDLKKITRCASDAYFAIVKEERGTEYEEYPAHLFSTLNLRARTINMNYVTYQSFTYDYNGGAHGYYTKNLISFDHVHRREIDFNYLFKPNSEKEVLELLLKEAKKTEEYQAWQPNILEFVTNRDEDGNPTGSYTFPQPGLSDEGIVFSFQPYAISCFAAGTFHFTIPYGKIKHCLTATGRWCLGLDD